MVVCGVGVVCVGWVVYVALPPQPAGNPLENTWWPHGLVDEAVSGTFDDRGEMRQRNQHRSRQWSSPRNATMAAPRSRRSFDHGKRARGRERSQTPFLPPEDWHEPEDCGARRGYRIIRQEPGEGYRHPVTPAEVRDRLALLPPSMVEPLAVVQLSCMTRKKRTVPCYGMQWGSALYLYPIEESLVEYFLRPPLEAEWREATMYGGRWEQTRGGLWRLIWTEDTIRDFYLNGILMHELGHLLDDRNRSYQDRERYADWFAIEYGYLASRAAMDRWQDRKVVRRHANR